VVIGCSDVRSGLGWLSRVNLPQFDGHFKKDTIEVEGVSNEKKNTVQQRVQARSTTPA